VYSDLMTRRVELAMTLLPRSPMRVTDVLRDGRILLPWTSQHVDQRAGWDAPTAYREWASTWDNDGVPASCAASQTRPVSGSPHNRTAHHESQGTAAATGGV